MFSFLSNFQPALVPLSHVIPNSETEDSVGDLSDSEDGSDLDYSSSDQDH